MPRRPAYIPTGAHGAMGFDEDLTMSDAGLDTVSETDEEGRDFMTGGTDLTQTPHGAVTTGSIVEQGGAVTADSPELEPMSDEEILAVIDAELSNCSAQYSGELAENRIDAMEYYLGQMPQAPAGRSQAVSTDVADVIEWTKPQVMEALCNGGTVAFDADNEEDEQAVQLETDACEHVLYTENSGFIYIYSIVQDALMQKNGVGKVYWDKTRTVEVEPYTGLTEAEAQQVLQPEDGTEVKPMAWDSYPAPGDVVDQETGEPVMLYDITVNRYRDNDGVKVLPLPPEEFLVARDHNSILLDDARFTAHKRLPTESDLIAEGWPSDMVRDLPTYSVDETGEREERRSLEDEKDFGYDASDRAVRRIQVIECYARIDRDRDGIAELLQVHVAGSGSYYLMGWEPIGSNPFVGTTGMLLTHKFYGQSMYDRVAEIQRQKTEVVRSLQDNLRHQNNSRLLVVAGQVNLDDLLTSRPGGIVRQKSPGMVEPLTAPQIGDMGYKQLEYLDSVRTGRAGVSPDTASVANAIAGDTAHGLERLMSAKEELTGLMIRLFAETLSRGTLFKIRALLQQHRDTPMHFKARGEWHQVDPTEWTRRTGATVQPGLGNGDRMKRMGALQQIGQQQTQAWQDPELKGVIVTEENLYHSASEFVRATNLRDPSPFWQDPNSPQAQQVKQQRAEQQQKQQQAQQEQGQLMIQTQVQLDQMKEETKRSKAQSDAMQAQSDLMFKYQDMFSTLEQKYTDLELKYSVDVPGKGMEGGADAS